jgi:hypothetical protein
MSDTQDTVSINLVSGIQRIGRCVLTFTTCPPWAISAECDKLGRIDVHGSDLFECLSQIRLQVEKIGCRLACNGSRLDVWPSGMARDMSGAKLAYEISSTMQKKLVRIFDEAPSEKLATVAEQKRWCSEIIKKA